MEYFKLTLDCHARPWKYPLEIKLLRGSAVAQTNTTIFSSP
jgi:hypothetical protein